jgi:hypothetical protein
MHYYEFRDGKHGFLNPQGFWKDTFFLTERRARLWIARLNATRTK